ncbi:MAG: GIY-YIG nuclease family protein [Sphingobacteriaceae bacterium]|nr:GIY-YIG nuclease family protein [Sphingobacteriaceae bacterium]
MEKFITYILKSLRDGKYYYGSCQNLEARLKNHNSGRVRSTKSRRPLAVHYQEEFATRSEAYKREIFFKTIDGYNWLKKNKIIGYN